ncbi:MAG: SDR family oxidoreductase [Candidatus Omnitrophica bacterium]|nr:SDR family oxidoreductase [Candidatus Omnitrophota bacterium]
MKRHSLVIGGTGGIGSAFARSVARAGHVVSVIGRRLPSEAEPIPHVRYYAADLSCAQRLGAVLTEILRRSGKLSSLIFFQRFRGEEDPWVGEMEISLTATKNTIERLTDDFSRTDERSIVVVSSIASRFIVEEQPVGYHVAKAGLNQMVRYYAVALGPKGIRVNSVSPGTVLKEGSSPLSKRIIPLGRMGRSEDVVRAVEFLCSPQASFITGQEIIVDGGLSLRSQESVARELALQAVAR